jgi:hypothetical protein
MANLKIRADSLEAQVRYHQAYWDNVKNVLAGKVPSKLDTVTLQMPEVEKTED